MRELVALSNSRTFPEAAGNIQQGRSERGLRRAAKRVAPESGGREGLLRAVNPARDMLRFMRFEWVRGRHEGARILWWGQVWGPGTPDLIKERHLRHQATPLKDLGGLSGESVRQTEMKAITAMRGTAAA